MSALYEDRAATLLVVLSARLNQPISLNELTAVLFPAPAPKSARGLTVQAIATLRAWVKAYQPGFSIQTVHGRGYMLCLSDPAADRVMSAVSSPAYQTGGHPSNRVAASFDGSQ